jgi:hypothetical protein
VNGHANRDLTLRRSPSTAITMSHRAPCALADFTLQLSSYRFHDASTNEISD